MQSNNRGGVAYWPIIKVIKLRSDRWTVLKQGGQCPHPSCLAFRAPEARRDMCVLTADLGGLDTLTRTGVLVDLPGTRDANAARAAVCGKGWGLLLGLAGSSLTMSSHTLRALWTTETFMKQCSCLLICAPIHRAVDNRTAKVGEKGALARQSLVSSKTLGASPRCHSLAKWEPRIC